MVISMIDLLKKVISIFQYKEPVTKEGGFELLEDFNDNYHKYDYSNPQDKKQNESIPRKNVTKEIKPLHVGGWNKEKKLEKKSESSERLYDNSENVSKILQLNMEHLRKKLNISVNQDITIREFNIAQKTAAFIVFINGMVDKTTINQSVLAQLMNPDCFTNFKGCSIVDFVMKNVISIHGVSKTQKLQQVATQVLNGATALFIDNCEDCLLLESKGYEKRNISPPRTETVIKGSQEGFTEDLDTSLTLIRRIIRNEQLVSEIIPVGQTNKINCAILYLKGIANPRLIKEIKRRISKIDIDYLLGDGMLEQLIEDNPFMLFPQCINTERPDRAASFIAEGHVVVISDGTPFALAVPVTFFTLVHTSEETMLRWQYGTFIRLVRYAGIFLAVFLPGLYVSLSQFHHEMIPTPLLATIISTKENVPFPIILEVLLMELSFELMREGGIRIPGIIGQTLGIVGALILGQAAVAAGLVSPILIIIVAVTGIGSFVVPNYSLALGLRITRFIFLLFGAVMGFYGIAVGLTILGAMACSMKSFGVPFLSPVSPKTKSGSDTIIRYPLWMQRYRPDYLNTPARSRSTGDPRKWKRARDDTK